MGLNVVNVNQSIWKYCVFLIHAWVMIVHVLLSTVAAQLLHLKENHISH